MDYNIKSDTRFVMEYTYEKDLKESFGDFWDDYEDFMASHQGETYSVNFKYVEMTEWDDPQDESLVGYLYGDFEDDEGVTKDEL